MEYSTQTEANTFCETFNKVDASGRVASWVRVGPCQYKVTITECPEFVGHFFGKRAA